MKTCPDCAYRRPCPDCLRRLYRAAIAAEVARGRLTPTQAGVAKGNVDEAAALARVRGAQA